MILVDTSVWVEHLRHGLPRLATLLQDGEVLIHPWVIGELACGNLRNRSEVLELLQGLPAATVASDAEVLLLIERLLPAETPRAFARRMQIRSAGCTVSVSWALAGCKVLAGKSGSLGIGSAWFAGSQTTGVMEKHLPQAHVGSRVRS